MKMFAGLDIGGKRTAICVMDDSGKPVWRGTVDTYPEMIDGALAVQEVAGQGRAREWAVHAAPVPIA